MSFSLLVRRSRFVRHTAAAVLAALAPLALAAPPAGEAESTAAALEAAHRGNNRGVALLEQYRYDDAARAFRDALAKDPGLTLARVNLAIALVNVPDLPGAEREARAAIQKTPDLPHAHYVLGLALRGQGRNADAQAEFRRVLALDPRDVGAHVNVGQLLVQERRYAEAVQEFRAALEAEPYNGTAAYNLSLALTRSGERDEARAVMQRFETLRSSGAATLIGTTYPEQGRYAEALSAVGAEPDLVDSATPAVRFVDATRDLLAAEAAPAQAAAAPQTDPASQPIETPVSEAARRALLRALGGRLTLFDYDGDGSLDILDVGPDGQRLYRNDAGRFADATTSVGLDPAQGGLGAVAGDCDADNRPDIFVLRDGGGTLLRQKDGRFADATQAAGIARESGLYASAAFVDADHDGDLDLLLVGFADPTRPVQPGAAAFPEGFAAAPHRLYRNDGHCVFKETAETSGLAAGDRAVAVAPTDYDNRRDVDLVLVARGVPPRLLRNQRDQTFRDEAASVGLTQAAAFTSLAAGDVNKDGFTDIFFGVADGPDLLALSDRRGGFQVAPAPADSSQSRAALFVDYDADGLLDLVTVGTRGLRALRHLGARWADVSTAALGDAAAALAGAQSLAAGDLDGDGDTDIALRDRAGALRLLRNDGASRHASVSVQLSGLVSNRGGVGAKVEVRAGSLWQKLETSSATPPVAPADVVFGLGRRTAADAVRVLWPAGILQTEIIEPSAGGPRTALSVQELDRKPSSCPYLYAWDGERFRFLTDFMGGGEMGYFLAPGVTNTPDPVEYVRIVPEQLRPRDGRYELRVTNELEEALFVDRLALVAVTHPAGVAVFPYEGMTSPPKPHRLYAVRDLRPPRAAYDGEGRDHLDNLRALDRRFADGFGLRRIRGYAEDHVLTLDLGEVGERPVLLLTGWTDYAFSSDNVAAHQAGLAMRPPSLEVRDAGGRWHTAVEQVGIPVGRPQSVVVDLAGVWRGPSREVRLVTNMRIYWDQARVGEAADVPLETQLLEAQRAELRERGFSAQVTPDGREPYTYDYTRVSWMSSWKVMAGRYTRVGDVRELLAEADDFFVISRPGDEIALSFDAAALQPAAAGRERTFLLFSHGYSKEMDVNSASPDTVEPLPFRAMTRYPYGPDESFPMTDEKRARMESTHTRVVLSPLPVLALTEKPAEDADAAAGGGE